ARLSAGGERGQPADGGAAATVGDAVAGAIAQEVDPALVAELGEAGDGADAEDVGPRLAIDEIGKHVESLRLAGFSERTAGGRSDEEAGIAPGQIDQHLRRFRLAELAEGPRHRAPHLRIFRL